METDDEELLVEIPAEFKLIFEKIGDEIIYGTIRRMKTGVDIDTCDAKTLEKQRVLLYMSIIRVQIKTSIPGIIDGNQTIPFQACVQKTWEDIFRENDVRMDPNLHQLRACGKPINNLKSTVLEYFVNFKSNRSTYHAIIVPRPIPKPPKKRNRRPPQNLQNPEATNSARKATRSRSQAQGGFQHNFLERGDYDRLPSFTSMHANIKRRKSPPFPSAPVRYLSFRDESTMAGEVLRPEETEVKPKVLQYFRAHCSNRDMLNIRTELLELKRQKKFQALNRLIPFTAGLLQNAFVDED